VEELRLFRESWANKHLSAKKTVEHLKSFFRFCHESNWIKENPAKSIKAPKIADPSVLPFSDEEIQKILKACGSHPSPPRALRIRALVLLMLHSGLRIGDACTFRRDRIHKGILELFTAKSGTKVRLPLHPDVMVALKKLPAGDYYFWSGESTRKTCINVWEETFHRMFERTGIDGAHSHRLRHTFAVRLLQNGVSMEHTSILLGHQNIRITQKHYASWVKERQQLPEEEVKKTW